MQKYRHKDDYLEVTAVRLTKENAEEVAEWCGGHTVEMSDAIRHEEKTVGINLLTRAGKVRAVEGDYIMKQNHHFVTIKPSLFGTLYEPVGS